MSNRIKTKISIMLTVLTILFAGCTNHYMTKQMLLDQVFSRDQLQTGSTQPITVLTPNGVTWLQGVRYDSNKLSRILCCNREDQKVLVAVNQNTMLIVTDKKGEVHKFYLDTLYLENDILYGLRSRLLGVAKSVPLDEIDIIEIYTELSREKLLETETPPGYREGYNFKCK